MHIPTAAALAALLTLAAAATATLAADHPPHRARHLWRFPVAVTSIAAVNIALTVNLARRPEPVPGTVVLFSTLLLLHAIQRRARARRPPRPPRPRQPMPTTTGTNHSDASAAAPSPSSSTDSASGGEEQRRDRRPPPSSGVDGQVRTAHRWYPSGGGRRLPAERPWRNGHHPAEHKYP